MRLKSLQPPVASMGARLRLPPKIADQLYRSPDWRRLIAAIKRVRGNACSRCSAKGTETRIIGDHIREVRDGGAPLDPANVQLLCIACHNAKTARERAARARGRRR